MSRTGNKNHASPTSKSGFGNGIAHFAAGPIADETHGINGFLSWAGGDQHNIAFQILWAEQQAGNFLSNGDGFGQSSRTGSSTGQQPFAGFHNDMTSGTQCFNIP